MTNNDGNDNNKPGMKTTDKNEQFDPSRRRFVKNTGIALGGVVGGSLLGSVLTNQFLTEKTAPIEEQAKTEYKSTEARMFFTRYEDFAVLEQATERIFPEDDHGPGAILLGVPYFIDKQLAGPWGMNGEDYRHGPFVRTETSTEQSSMSRGELFIKGLRKMNQLSQERFDTPYYQAEEEQQIEILQDFDDGKVDLKGVDSGSFFALLRMTVLEGVYSDPLYGGNRNMAGWKMKEFPGPVASYLNEIESEDFVKLEPISLTDYQQKS